MPIRAVSLSLAITLAAAAHAPAIAQDTPLARTRAAFARADVPGAEAAAREVLSADTVAEHQREALATLTNLAWRVRRDSAAAQQYLRDAMALPLSFRRGGLLLQRARCELSFGDPAAALTDSRTAVGTARSLTERISAMGVISQATLALFAAGQADSAQLAALVAELVAAVREAPGETGIARYLVVSASLSHDGPALLAGWQSYYLLFTKGGTTNVLSGPRDSLARLLPRWVAASDDRPTRRAIVYALADSRFFEAAAQLAGERLADGTTLAANDARAREIVAWARFIRDARRTTNEFYRTTALHAANETAWHDSVTTAARAVWRALAWRGAPPDFTLERFFTEARTRFGAITTGWGSTAGFRDLHFGHSVDDERRAVTQHGRTAGFRFVQLDEMISNGFLTWFWDGASSDGGWQNSEMVVQVRPAYTSNPLSEWTARTDTLQRRVADERIAADSAADLGRARTTPVAFFPSVVQRLARKVGLALIDSLKGTGLTGDALRAGFVRVWSDETQEFSIFQHEGRHAIDNGIEADGNCGKACKERGGKLSPADLEFTAKLSQVEFGVHPEIAFSNIIAPNVGDQTPHGTANARIMRGLLDWMTAHVAEIAGVDRSAPLLPQLPLLTSTQLRDACRSLDPLARDGEHR